MDRRRTAKHRLPLWLPLSAAILLGLIAALSLGWLFDIGGVPHEKQARIQTAIPTQEAAIREAHLYFPTGIGNYLGAEKRRVETGDTFSAGAAVVSALLQGPEDPSLVSPIPAGTRLRHFFLTQDGTAYVDFSPELSLLHGGGVSTERLTLYAIVNTLVLNFEEIERVHILLQGKPSPTLAGHLDIRHPKTADLLLIR